MPCTWCGFDNGCDCLERIACDKAGEIPHLGCGWCEHHAGPRFECLGRCAHWRLARVWAQTDGTAEQQWPGGWWAQVLNPSRDEPNAVWGHDPRDAWDKLQKELTKAGSSALIRPNDDKSREALKPAHLRKGT